jgi:hypothetical protein
MFLVNKKISLALLMSSLSIHAMASNYQDQESLPVNSTVISYKFPIKDYAGQPIDNVTIMASIAKSVLENTNYVTLAKKGPCSSWSSEAKCALRTGTYITIGKDQIIVDFHNVKNESGKITSSLAENDVYNNVSFNLRPTFSTQESYTLVKLMIPNQADINASNMSITRYDKLAPALDLYNNIVSAVQPNKVSLSRYEIVDGEVNNKFTPAAIYGNFDRILGKYNWNKGIKCDTTQIIVQSALAAKEITTSDLLKCKADQSYAKPEEQQQAVNDYVTKFGIPEENVASSYKYKLNPNSVIPVNIVVYPYRDQSKAVYKAIIPYQITSDGKMHIESAEVNNIHASIESAVNN